MPSTNSKDKTEKQLCQWVNSRRKDKKKGTLTDDKIKKLELIKGWYWQKNQTTDTNTEESSNKSANDNIMSDIDDDILKKIIKNLKAK
jgi:hypothetical protein